MMLRVWRSLVESCCMMFRRRSRRFQAMVHHTHANFCEIWINKEVRSDDHCDQSGGALAGGGLDQLVGWIALVCRETLADQCGADSDWCGAVFTCAAACQRV